nr:META domain-containing protein [Candidatus Paceibacterota bacterium]
DGTALKPSTPDVFTMLFDGPRVSLGTDCNTGSSEYVPPTGTSSIMTFGAVAATKKFCESKEEGPYFEMVSQIKSYEEADNGNLTFTLADGSTMVFVREGQALEYADDTAAADGE